ncbi:uncharacterized protein TRIADDRAFT_49802 [Trichoplax adhaerens]|uniref:Splicing factor 3B subunit 3 n=1 Tax=Trichoplax adhaerens TaxID=10228 RepID=B3RJF1_TRIAD|nr:hypothetical protein TRIADDRAFT_49802 [Trichoplax adhaerens]EDV29081.1 hypothetical protein TRIADDRAFT_49802 [Trichoplax adhaerens]|eukprot:XP_002108283.1 hypothetical protein TRIADDRAFT_49802 [Trichoplax adhaerens]
MYLYSLTLQKSSCITCAVHGNFSGTKQQEIIAAKGKVLELLRPDANSGKVHSITTLEVFGEIRCLAPFRLTGGSKDYVVIGSDSGRITILEYIPSKNTFEKIHQETFGKSGCRRIVPGQYLAVDPKGRAVMIGAMEKQKLVYILNRDTSARLTISSPLEAHKSHTVVFSVVGIDVGFENPVFACLEVDYEEADNDPTGEAALTTRQMLTYYELDLGLNHVVRKFTETLQDFSNMLIPVPGGNDGPSGILVCSENFITYKNFGDQPDIRMPIPRRRYDLSDPDRGILFVCYAGHKTKSLFFFFIQNEQGDIFKLTLTVEDDMVSSIKLKYFDTIPVASSMIVLKTGFLFASSEFGNHHLYQIAHLGDNDEETEFSSTMLLDEGETFYYSLRPLKNLVEVDEVDSLCPITGCQVADLANEDTPQLYVSCGRGPNSTLRILRHGLEVTEMAVSELPGNPNGVWTVKTSASAEYDAYIVVSFVNATLVLSIGESVEEVSDSGFLGTTPTLHCCQIGDDALLQVYANGIRHVRADKRVNEWKAPGKKIISKCAVNNRQVAIALTGGELVYFEMDLSGQLNEYTERREFSSEVICMSIGSVPVGEKRCRFLAVGLADHTVRMISLDPSDCLQPMSMQALPTVPESLCIVAMGSGDSSESEQGVLSTYYLNIGLQNGVLLRSVLDSVTGDMSDTRTRYLGSRPVRLFKVKIQNSEAVLAISSRSWLGYMFQSVSRLTPLSYDALDYASGFSSDQCPEGVVSIAGDTLRILALEKLGAVFNQMTINLKLTPRRFAIDQQNSNLVVVGSDHLCFTDSTKSERKQQMAKEIIESAGDEEAELAKEVAESFMNEVLPATEFGEPKAGNGQWASCIQLLAPDQSLELDQDEAALSVAICRFAYKPDETFVVVGVAKELNLNPSSSSGGLMNTYRMANGQLELVHKTVVEEVPRAMAAFQGRLLVGTGRILRVYDLGRKKLLRKCENKNFPYRIVTISSMGSRVIVGDVQESVHFVKYRAKENRLVVFADDVSPRYVTATCFLDYDTIAVGDKFGSIAILRLSDDINDEIEEDPTGAKAFWDRGLLNGASQKANLEASFYIGETVMSLQKTTIIPGGSESLIYTTLSGSIGVLLPFTSREEVDFFQHLEMHLRSENAPICGRDHLAYRSYYFPAKNVIDGDMCEQFNALDGSKRRTLAMELDRTPPEISKKLEDMRTRYAF